MVVAGAAIADLEKLTGVAVRAIHTIAATTTAVEPVMGHLKDDHRMRRNYLKGRDGDRINAVLAAGFNFSLLLRWFAELCPALRTFFTDDPITWH
jgi:hypothetical protein